MRIITSLFILVLSNIAYSQRLSFEDPDLTFSFEKPKEWEVYDDGYVVKVSPSVLDSANIYFTITYFEDAQGFGLFPNKEHIEVDNKQKSSTLKIDGKTAKVGEEKKDGSNLSTYTFMKYGQRFELKTSSTKKKQKRIFRKIISSIQITK
ncbi:hypothetical protein [Ekhidna sp.]